MQSSFNFDRAAVLSQILKTSLSGRQQDALRAILQVCWPNGQEQATEATASYDSLAATMGVSRNTARPVIESVVAAGFVAATPNRRGWSFRFQFNRLFGLEATSDLEGELVASSRSPPVERDEAPQEPAIGQRLLELLTRICQQQSEMLLRLDRLEASRTTVEASNSVFENREESQQQQPNNQRGEAPSSKRWAVCISDDRVRRRDAGEVLRLFNSARRQGLASPEDELTFIAFCAFVMRRTSSELSESKRIGKPGGYIRCHVERGDWRFLPEAEDLDTAQEFLVRSAT